jgi:hypothetical protein
LGDITFNANGRVIFPTKYHGDVAFSKGKWDAICSKPERYYYRHNGEKVATTLITPDFVRHHKDIPTQFFYYKRFETFKIAETIEGPMACKLMAVVIDTATQRLCTVYPTDKPKTGSRQYKPQGS